MFANVLEVISYVENLPYNAQSGLQSTHTGLCIISISVSHDFCLSVCGLSNLLLPIHDIYHVFR